MKVRGVFPSATERNPSEINVISEIQVSTVGPRVGNDDGIAWLVEGLMPVTRCPSCSIGADDEAEGSIGLVHPSRATGVG
jgi:hypothetical protein